MSRVPSHFLTAVAICVIAAMVSYADPVTTSMQFGAERLEFPLEGGRAFLIRPTRPAPSGAHPWVWYAPTFINRHPDDSHTWMATQLLDAGFAIGGIEVGESYGSPAGTKAYSQFYDHVVREYGLDSKPCLLAQSRGGLMLLNWAIENVERVQCIAGIYTVCSIESYPGVEKAASAYGLDADTLRTKLDQFDPLPRVEKLAKAQVPMLFVHGDSDTVVPIENNSGALVERCTKLGGNARLIVVKGKGHEVCPEFFQSAELMAFLLLRGKSK